MDFPPMVSPSTGSTVAFLAIVAALVVAFVAGVRKAAPQHTVRAALGIAAYLAVTAWISASGILESSMLPPPTALFFGGCLIVAIALALGRVGGLFAQHIPVAVLIGVQSFRLPLELVLHQWHVEGVIPVQLTYSGHNFDIVSGIGGLVVGIALATGRAGPRLALAYNVLGLALLVAVATIAMLSVPTPLRSYTNDPILLLPFNAPYSWIVPICVGGALFAHLVTFRALKKPATVLGSGR